MLLFPKKLEWLDLHDNQIEDLGNYYKLGEGFALKTLDVRSNQIKRIESLSLIQSIRTVLLNNNHISKIKDRAFNGKPNLLKVDLSNNRIRDLTLSALSVETSNTASIKGKPCLKKLNITWYKIAMSSFSLALERTYILGWETLYTLGI